MDPALEVPQDGVLKPIHRDGISCGPQDVEVLLDVAPHASQEAVRSLHAPLRPVQIVLGRRGEEDEEPDRVCTVLFHDLRRVHDVAPQ